MVECVAKRGLKVQYGSMANLKRPDEREKSEKYLLTFLKVSASACWLYL